MGSRDLSLVSTQLPGVRCLARHGDAGVLRQLEHLNGCLATLGHTGVIGPVALASARLHLLAGRPAQSRALPERARRVSQHARGGTALVRCELLHHQIARAEGTAVDAAAVAAVAAAAQARGLLAVAHQARDLVR